VAEETVEGVRNVEDGTLTAGSGFPAEWWTPPADVAMREQDPRGGALRLSDRVARFDRSTKGGTQAAGLRRRREARRRMKPHRKVGWTADEERPRGPG